MEILPTVPFEERPERFILFPYSRPRHFWYYGKVFEWGWKKFVHFIGRDFIAEFLGTMVFISFAIGSSAQAFFRHDGNTGWIGGTWGASVGLTFGLYISKGGHCNPSLSVALALVGKFPWWKVPFFCLVQFLGAFMAAVINYLYYFDAIRTFDGGSRVFNGLNETFRIWTTNPLDTVSNANVFWDQFWSTFLLMFLILAVVDRTNTGLVDYLRPIGIGLVVFALGTSFGYNGAGGANPVRDFPPRCFAAFMWGAEIFRVHDYYFWVAIIAPLLGAPVGALSYVFFIETHNYPASEPVIRTLTISGDPEKQESRNVE